MMLKLSLPGVDPGNIPTLTAEQVAQIPGVFLDFLHEIGQVTDLGDLKIITLDNDQHNFTITSIARWIANGRLETGELRVEQLQRKSDRAQITYDPNTHEKDIRFVATAEIHAHFLQRLGLYGFSISAKIDDLQAYLCKTIRTEYPVYEAELIAIVTTVFKHTDDLRHFDSALAGFVSERMFCLREILGISAKDRFLALAGRANLSVLELALAELREGVGEVDETDALLETFIEQHRVRGDVVLPIRPASLATPSTLGKRKRGVSSKAEAQAGLVGSGHPRPTSDDSTQNTPDNAAPDGRAQISPSNNPRKRRAHPGQSMWTTKPPGTTGPQDIIRIAKPSVKNEYWSIDTKEWNGLSTIQQRKITHASNICETEAGMVAPEPCFGCHGLGLVCEVYTDNILHRNLGVTCARCRVNGDKCSHAAGRKNGPWVKPA